MEGMMFLPSARQHVLIRHILLELLILVPWVYGEHQATLRRESLLGVRGGDLRACSEKLQVSGSVN